MKVGIVYPNKSLSSKLLAEDLSKEITTYPRLMNDFNYDESFDYLVIIYEQSLNSKQVKSFINQLSRNHIKNMSLCYMYKISDKHVHKMVDLCHQQDIPLMRELYTCKIPFIQKPYLQEEILSHARTYMNDMITIIHNYY